MINSRSHWPAVNHHGPSVGQGLGFDSSNKPQQTCGMIGDTVVRPACEVKLAYLPDLMSTSLRNRVIVLNKHSASVGRPHSIQHAYCVKDPSKANIELDWMQTCTSCSKVGVWAEFPLSYSKHDVQGWCSFVDLQLHCHFSVKLYNFNLAIFKFLVSWNFSLF